MTNNITQVALDYAKKHDTDIFCINSDIYTGMEFSLYKALDEIQPHKNIIVILITLGGSAEGAYKMMRLLQDRYENVDIMAPSYCDSAGTIMATGARKIYMTELSEFGPIDLQIPKNDGTGRHISNLALDNGIKAMTKNAHFIFEDFYEALDQRYPRFTEETKYKIAQNMGEVFIKAIADQIKPESLGINLRERAEGRDYAERLNQKYNNLKDGAVSSLLYDYPSHNFVIDYWEACDLFKDINLITGDEAQLIDVIGVDNWKINENPNFYFLNQEEKDKRPQKS